MQFCQRPGRENDQPNGKGVHRKLESGTSRRLTADLTNRTAWLVIVAGNKPNIFYGRYRGTCAVGVFRNFSYPAPKITKCHRHNLTSANVFRLKICPKSLSTGAYFGVKNRGRKRNAGTENKAKLAVFWGKFIWQYRDAQANQGLPDSACASYMFGSGGRICGRHRWEGYAYYPVRSVTLPAMASVTEDWGIE